MIVLSLDPSLTRTGYAIFSAPPARLMDLMTGSFGSADPADFVGRVLALIDEHGVDFVASEECRKVILMYGKKQLVGTAVTPNADQLKLSQLEGGLRGICAARHIPLALVPPQTWRAKVLGNGHLSRADAKKAAVQYCRYLKIDAANHDVAEAICVGLWATSCNADFRLAAHQEQIGRAL